MKVTILGANSLLAQHLIKHIQTETEDVEITTWCYQRHLANKLALTTENITHYLGISNLENAIKYADIVLNLHEHQDFSIIPNKKALNFHNVEFVRSLMFLLKGGSNRNQGLIHLSSTFIQCQKMQPNVFKAEMEADRYTDIRPFEEYCKSKVTAENLIKKSNVDHFIIRPVPMYGPGDECSVITDFISFSTLYECVPNIGDHGGVVQLAYAGNVAVGVWKSIVKLFHVISSKQLPGLPIDDSSDSSSDDMENFNTSLDSIFIDDSEVISETIILADDNESKSLYETFGQLMCNGKRPLSQTYIPFLPLYFLYVAFTMIVCFLSKWIEIPKVLRELPEPYYFSHYLHNWTYFDTNKSHCYLKYENKYSLKETMELSRPHYRRMSGITVERYSWSPAIF